MKVIKEEFELFALFGVAAGTCFFPWISIPLAVLLVLEAYKYKRAQKLESSIVVFVLLAIVAIMLSLWILWSYFEDKTIRGFLKIYL